MKRWAIVVVGLYALAMTALIWPVCMSAFWPEVDADDCLEVLQSPPYWIWLGVMLLCQACLLIVPVKVAVGRPVARRSIYVSIVVSGFLVFCLAFGAVCAISEFVTGGPVVLDDDFWSEAHFGPSILAACVLIWEIWAIIFYRQTHSSSARDVVSQQCRHLLRGSILELLIAVPTHVVARSRDTCCAGFGTFIGIVFGLSVMLASFGPGVFFLYVERWRKLHPEEADS